MKTVTRRAHGRVNLIGEHTDYNEGWVLPTTIPQYTEVTISEYPGNNVHVISTRDHGTKREMVFALSDEIHTGTWIDYIQGATKILQERGLSSGFKAEIYSTIPEGSGLSSSAALEMSLLKAVRDFFHLDINDIDLALIGQRVENEFVGARVGIMDQMATSLASYEEALFLDTKTLTFERIPLPMNEMDLLVINSGISHKLSSEDGGYNQRRQECEDTSKILGKSFREISSNDIEDPRLSEIHKKRARHVFTENQRVKEAVRAIQKKDMLTLGTLFKASHESMKNDYQVSIPEIDLLVDLLNQHKDVYGARLTGGGFGGSVVAITKKGEKEKVALDIIPIYEKESQSKGTVLV
jgi:galactokinase